MIARLFVLWMTAGAALAAFAGTGTSVACKQRERDPWSTCAAARDSDSTGAVTIRVTFPNGFARSLTFDGDRFLRADTTMSGVGTDTDQTRIGDDHLLRVDDQHFRMPHALIVGQ